MSDTALVWAVVALSIIAFAAILAIILVALASARSKRPRIPQGQRAGGPPDGTAAGGGDVWVIVNPIKPANYPKFKALVDREVMEATGRPARWLETTVEDPGTGQAVEALRENPALVIAAGGDGTVRAVAAAMAHSRTPMGLLPMGTGNLLARNLNIPLDTLIAVQVALNPVSRRIDLAWLRVERVETPSQFPPEGELLARAGAGSVRKLPNGVAEPRMNEYSYLVIAGVGFDGETMAQTTSTLKKRVGWSAYVFTALSSLRIERMKATVTIFKTEDEDAAAGRDPYRKIPGSLPIPKSVQNAVEASHTLGSPDGVNPPIHSQDKWDMTAVRARTILFANCGELPFALLAPNALVDDGRLDIIAIDTKGGLLGWAYLSAKIFGNQAGISPVNTKHDLAQIQFRQTQDARVDISKPYPVQVDGDPIGEARTVYARVDPGALIMRVAPGSPGAIPEWDRRI